MGAASPSATTVSRLPDSSPIAPSGVVMEQCCHLIFEEHTEFIRAKLDTFWKAAA
jgi:hypothetical protein